LDEPGLRRMETSAGMLDAVTAARGMLLDRVLLKLAFRRDLRDVLRSRLPSRSACSGAGGTGGGGGMRFAPVQLVSLGSGYLPSMEGRTSRIAGGLDFAPLDIARRRLDARSQRFLP